MPDSNPIDAGIMTDAALFAATSAYAVWLYQHRKDASRNWTWFKVVLGDAAVLAAAAARYRLVGGSYERIVWRAFVIGGTPIIVGELAQWLVRHTEARAAAKEADDGRTPPGW